jgi:methylation protein EvaC
MGEVIKKNSYDQIYDEHVYLFSLESILRLAEFSNLQLFDADPQKTHGGSMRYYLCKKRRYSQTKRLKKLIKIEKKLKLDKLSTYKHFAKRVYKSKIDLVKLLKKLKKDNKKISAYGATSKSTTIFNYCNIGSNLIDNYYDSTKIKQNKFSPGMHIPVKSFSKMKKYPDYFFLSAWNHQKEIFGKEKNFKKEGGRWILHVPKVRTV